MKYLLFLLACMGLITTASNAQEIATTSSESKRANSNSEHFLKAEEPSNNSTQEENITFFLAYDFGEAAFNQFKSLGSEFGIRFTNAHHLRLAFTYLHLSEQHLASEFAKAVDGDHVKGKQVGLEFFYDFPIVIKNLYVAPSIGYYTHEYTHTISNEQLKQSSFTLGTAISYSESDIFRIKGLYYRASIPFRFHLNPINETQLGDATIKSNVFDNSIWLFIGFQFPTHD